MHLALATAGLPPVLGAAAPKDCAACLRPANEGRAAASRSFQPDKQIYAEGDRPAHFYRVLSGTVRTYRILCDGRRQIDGFHFAGDIFGLETGDERRFSADAVAETTVAVHRRADRDALAQDGGSLAREIVASIMGSLERAQDHMMLLGRKSARERIASFLLGLSRRVGVDGLVELPMSRVDIADHLGLTVESVSRSFTQLEREDVIAIPASRRAVVLKDKAALHRLDA